MRDVVCPPGLRPGAVIGLFTSSYPLAAEAPEAAELARANLEAMGYRVKPGALMGRRDFYRSGSIQERAREFNALLAYIDYEQIKRRPKIVIGHSDVTALLLGIYAVTGVVTYYGPNFVTTFGQHPPFLEDTARCMRDVLERGTLPYTYRMPKVYSDELTDWGRGPTHKEPKPNGWMTVSGGRARGRLIGGNLNTMTGIWGSGYMPEIHGGDILFLEDTEKFAAHAERYFSWLKLCGVFDRIGGLILGKHRQFDGQGTGRAPQDILLEVLGRPAFPILAGFDCGHTVPILTLPIGMTVELDADAKSVTLLE